SRLCDSELRHVLEGRRALEVEGARLAATARTGEDLRDLESRLDERETAYRRRALDETISTDARFHATLVAASHNPVLIGLYEGISEAVLSSVAPTVNPENPPG